MPGKEHLQVIQFIACVEPTQQSSLTGKLANLAVLNVEKEIIRRMLAEEDVGRKLAGGNTIR